MICVAGTRNFCRYLKLDALVRITVRNWKHSYFPTSKCRICLMRPFLFSHRYSSIIWFHEGQSPKMSIEFEYSFRRSSLELFNFSSIIYIYLIFKLTVSSVWHTYVLSHLSFFSPTATPTPLSCPLFSLNISLYLLSLSPPIDLLSHCCFQLGVYRAHSRQSLKKLLGWQILWPNPFFNRLFPGNYDFNCLDLGCLV